MIECPYNYISVNYNLTASKKQKSTKLMIYSKKALSVIKTLYRSGVITNFLIVKSLHSRIYIKFSIKYYNNLAFFRKLTTVSTSSKIFFVSYRTLKLSVQVFKTSIIILSTPYGLLTLAEALSKRTGGIIVYIVH